MRAPEELTRLHDVTRFDSGTAALDEWLKKRALTNQSSGASQTYVVCEGSRVVAYFAPMNAYIEVLSFDRVVKSAKERNQAIFDKLGFPAS